MIRSGSTLQYNIVSELLELKDNGIRLGWEDQNQFKNLKNKCEPDQYNIFKSHFLTEEISKELIKNNSSKLMYTYRDIRDICVSIMEKENKTFKQVFNSNVLHKAIEQYYIVMASPIKKYIQSYETIFLNTKQEISNTASFFNVILNDYEIEKIYNNISFESQKEKIEKFKMEKDFIRKGDQDFNQKTLLHTNHIKNGEIGKYRIVLTQEDIEILEQNFGDWLLENKYKLEFKTMSSESEKFRRYYGQHGEDYLLWKFFDYKNDGFFIEVGAFDGVYLSNTYSFEQEGWRGICIEPIPDMHSLCSKNREKSICIQAAAGSDEKNNELIEFSEDEMGLYASCITNERTEEFIEKCYENDKISYKGLKKFDVKIQSLNYILNNNNLNNQPIDFISIDVEGFELDVLRGLDLTIYAPKVLMVEANSGAEKEKIIDYLTEKKYLFVRDVSVNLFFVKNITDVKKMQDIVINCVLEKQVHPKGKEFSIKTRITGEVIWNNKLIFPKTDEFIINESKQQNKKIYDLIDKKEEKLQEIYETLISRGKELQDAHEQLQQKQEIIEAKNDKLQKKDKILISRGKELQDVHEQLQQKQEIIEAKTDKLQKKDETLISRGKELQDAHEQLQQKQEIIEAKNDKLQKKDKILISRGK
ncbi:MAG: FkbM family methyltransferase, partial [gamma proteobacterium symbiont of Bathyaustriella thionipta]|nr:FkbM family methyltransferase [gamma proteobacterium symbiont of Bathyaustriella thionipta]